MATIPNNLQFVPNRGTGDGTVSVSPKTTDDIHKGRIQSTTVVDGYMAGIVDPTVEVTVIQAAYPEFILREASSIDAANGGQQVALRGQSNSASLTFSVTTDPTSGGATLASSYTVQVSGGGQTTVNNGEAITGDPGAEDQYLYEMIVTIPNNPSIDERVFEITISNGASISTIVAITQGASEAYLWLNATGTSSITITIPSDGTAQSFSVLSNTTWTFETD